MTFLDDLPEGVRVGLDTGLFIYFVEDNPVYKPLVLPLFVDRLDQAWNEGVTSMVTLAEVLAQPLVKGRNDLVLRYRNLLTGHPNLLLAMIAQPIAERAADLSGRYRLRLPDAFQLATALEYGAGHFVTNDLQLKKVAELQGLVLDAYLPP